jgi:hypothetical protein
MWLCTTIGFFSIVAHATEEDTLVVRARCIGDLFNFRRRAEKTTLEPSLAKEFGVAALAVAPIVNTPMRDYAFRLSGDRVAVGIVVGELVQENAATNFKAAIAASADQCDKLAVYSGFHNEMEVWQEGGFRREFASIGQPSQGAVEQKKKTRKKPLATRRLLR